MGQIRNTPKTAALLVSAIRKLKNIHGSTSREITNYIASECEGPKKNLKRQLKLALRRGLTAGIIRRSKDGYYTCASLEENQRPDDRSRGCKRRRKRKSRCRSRRRKRKCGKRRRRMKCGKKRRSRKSKCRRRRRKRKCGGRRRQNEVEVEEMGNQRSGLTGKRGVKSTRNQSRTRNNPKSKNDSKASSEMRISSASSSGDTRGSGAETASATLSGKESITDRSDVSAVSDGTTGETKQ